MTKKLALLLVVLVLSWGVHIGIASAEPIFFGSTTLILNTGSEDGIGVGGKFDVGLPIGDQVILRGTYEAYKTADGVGYDNGFTGFTVMSNQLISKLKAGLYLTGEGGGSKVSGLPMEFATSSSMGFYSAIGQKTKLWLGGGYSTVADEGQIWSITLALSIQAAFE